MEHDKLNDQDVTSVWSEASDVVFLTQSMSEYTIPIEVMDHELLMEDLKISFASGDSERKLYCYVPLSLREQEACREFKRHAEKIGLDLDPELSPRVLAYIMDKRSRGSVEIAAQRLLETSSWRRTFFQAPIRDDSVLDDLNQGAVYFGGRDRGLRPMIVIRLDRLAKQNWDDQRLLRVFIFLLEFERKYLFVPGVCEQHVILVDFVKLGVLDLIHKKGVLTRLGKVLSSHYVGSTYRTLVANPPTLFKSIWIFTKSFLTEAQQHKVFMLQDEKDKALIDLFSPHQLEVTYGGTRPPLGPPYYPFQFVPGPFDPSYHGTGDYTTLPDMHNKLIRPEWKVWETLEMETEFPHEMRLKDSTCSKSRTLTQPMVSAADRVATIFPAEEDGNVARLEFPEGRLSIGSIGSINHTITQISGATPDSSPSNNRRASRNAPAGRKPSKESSNDGSPSTRPDNGTVPFVQVDEGVPRSGCTWSCWCNPPK